MSWLTCSLVSFAMITSTSTRNRGPEVVSEVVSEVEVKKVDGGGAGSWEPAAAVTGSWTNPPPPPVHHLPKWYARRWSHATMSWWWSRTTDWISPMRSLSAALPTSISTCSIDVSYHPYKMYRLSPIAPTESHHHSFPPPMETPPNANTAMTFVNTSLK